MTLTSRVLPRPFQPPKSFFDVGIGEEKVQIKPEWQSVLTHPAEAGRKVAA